MTMLAAILRVTQAPSAVSIPNAATRARRARPTARGRPAGWGRARGPHGRRGQRRARCHGGERDREHGDLHAARAEEREAVRLDGEHVLAKPPPNSAAGRWRRRREQAEGPAAAKRKLRRAPPESAGQLLRQAFSGEAAPPRRCSSHPRSRRVGPPRLEAFRKGGAGNVRQAVPVLMAANTTMMAKKTHSALL